MFGNGGVFSYELKFRIFFEESFVNFRQTPMVTLGPLLAGEEKRKFILRKTFKRRRRTSSCAPSPQPCGSSFVRVSPAGVSLVSRRVPVAPPWPPPSSLCPPLPPCLPQAAPTTSCSTREWRTAPGEYDVGRVDVVAAGAHCAVPPAAGLVFFCCRCGFRCSCRCSLNINHTFLTLWCGFLVVSVP